MQVELAQVDGVEGAAGPLEQQLDDLDALELEGVLEHLAQRARVVLLVR